MSLAEQLIARAKKTPARIVLPEGADGRILRAAARLASEGIARPTLLGASGNVPDGIACIDPADSPALPDYARAYVERREGIAGPVALRLVKRPLYYAAMMVAQGNADAMVAGVTKTTAQVISAAALCIGYAEGATAASGFFLMALHGPPERVLVFADAAINIDPTAEELAQIAVTTARSAGALLDIRPRVALLSFSTHGSASHARVEKVQRATRLARELAPDLLIDGELQADAALSGAVAQKKCPDSPVAGQANILIFPDLDAANIAYKLTQHLAGAQAIGPVMQGFRRPVNDLSRGASVDDIVAVSAIASLQSTGSRAM